MNTTSVSLLDRLQNPAGHSEAAWNRFIDIYAPLLLEWCALWQVPADERHDVVQNALVKILRSIARFRRQASGDFRKWLFVLARNCWLDRWRTRQQERQGTVVDAEQIAIPDPLDTWTEQEHRHYLLRRIAELVVADFPPSSQMIYQRYILEGLPAATVATELGVTVNAVYQVSRRLLQRIREELATISE